MLHIRCGTDIREKLQAAKVPGEYLSWHDPLCDGPCPAGLDRVAWRPMRAEFISRAYGESAATALAQLTEMDAALARFGAHEEAVLWFEHDLFDQPILAYLLDWFSRQDFGATRLSLVLVREHPEVERFYGLGNLNARQLGALFPERRPVTAELFAAGRAAWAAFTAPDPRAVAAIAGDPPAALRDVGPAFTRHLEEFPSTTNGLSRTEQWALDAVASGTRTLGDAFSYAVARERHPWLGDSMFYGIVRGLTKGPEPLLHADGPWPTIDQSDGQRITLSLTEAGRAVLDGRRDWVAIAGIDRWRGGVHLKGADAAWRWSPERRTVVAAS